MRRRLSIYYKLLIILSTAIGISLNIFKTTSTMAMLSYYTMLSNLICFVSYSIFLILDIREKEYKNKIYYILKGAIIMAIFLTAVVYRVGLMPNHFQMDSLKNTISNTDIANKLVHTVSPILVILEYFLFEKKGNFKMHYPIYWLIIPSFYVIYVYIYAKLGGRFFNIGGSEKFAYFFLDYESIGVMNVAKWIMLIMFFMISMSYILIYIDCKIGKKRTRR